MVSGILADRQNGVQARRRALWAVRVGRIPRDSMNVSSSAFATAPAFLEGGMEKQAVNDDGSKPASAVVVGWAVPATGPRVPSRDAAWSVVRRPSLSEMR